MPSTLIAPKSHGMTSAPAWCFANPSDVAFTHAGTVSVPHQSGHIYLIVNRNGQHRLIIVSRPTISGEMYGTHPPLRGGRGSQLMRVSARVVRAPTKAVKTIQLGQTRATDRCHALYRKSLKRAVDDQFAVFLAP